MSANPPADSQEPHRHVGELLLGALICALALFPPEARGESLAGSAALIVLLGLVTWRTRPSTWRLLPICLAGLLAVPLLRSVAAPGAAVEPYVILVLALAAGIYASAWPRRYGMRRLPRALVAAATVVSIHGIYQRLYGLRGLAQRIEEGMPVADRALVLDRLELGRAFAGFPTPAALGGFLVLSLPVTVGLAIEASGRRRWVWGSAGLLQLAALASTESGSAVAALLAALFVAGLRRPGWRRPLAAATILTFALLSAVLAMRGPELTDLDAPGSPWRLRAGNFRIAAAMIGDHPFVGTGPGGYAELYPAYRTEGDNESRYTHDLPLQLCAEWGIPIGALLSAGFFWFFLGPLLRGRSRSAPWSGVAIGLSAFAFQNLLDFTAFLPSILWISAMLAGRLHASPQTGEASESRALPAVALAALASVLVAATLAAGSGLAANDRHASAEAEAAGDRDRALQLADRATRRAPWNVDGWLAFVRMAGAAVEVSPERRREAAERAVSLSPVRPAARLARARLRLDAGDPPGAYADAAKAAELYPLSVRYASIRDEIASRFVREAPPAGSGR